MLFNQTKNISAYEFDIFSSYGFLTRNAKLIKKI